VAWTPSHHLGDIWRQNVGIRDERGVFSKNGGVERGGAAEVNNKFKIIHTERIVDKTKIFAWSH
jgi:hypothetical protein